MSTPVPNSPKRPRILWIVLGILAIVIIGTSMSIASSNSVSDVPPLTVASSSDSPMPVDPAPTTAAVATTQAVPTKAPAPPKPRVLMTVKGSGIKNTPQFTTGDNWTIKYAFDCSKQMMGGSGNFIISDDTDMPLINELQVKGAGSNPEYANSGTHYLKINSECDWKVTVTG